jgi:diadenosine tetraphosphate (Ap4A) HIT family hydrolase
MKGTINKKARSAMGDFVLDPRIRDDSLLVAELPLSAVRLMRDANYPWLVLVPRLAGITEIIDLDARQRAELMTEIALASEALRAVVPVDKLNIASLGNVVPQLHVHVIARVKGDAAWPRPVWGAVPSIPYPPGEAEALADTLAAHLR